MRVLVTGSNGRVGKLLTEQLAKLGYEVIGFDVAEKSLSDDCAGYYSGHLEDKEAVERAACGVESVIHLGAFMSWNNADSTRIFDANVLGTFHLLEAVAANSLSRFILASSGEVYPENGATDLPIDEHHPTRPTTYYGMSKLLCEQMVWFFARKHSLPCVVLRFEHTQDAKELLAPDSFFSGARFFLNSKIDRLRELGSAEQLAVLEALYDGSEKLLISMSEDGTPHRMPILDTRDLVAGIISAMTAEGAVGRTIGLGPDEATSFDRAIQLIQDVTGIPSVEARLPGVAVNYSTSNALAREVLGFRPTHDFATMVKEAASKRET